MKDILVLLVLLNAQITKVCSQPYEADSDGNCLNSTREYLVDNTNLCCKKCQPGQRLKQTCSKTTETVCEPCPEGQYMENWNYSPNCFSCNKCKRVKGLRDFQDCSSTTSSKCVCQSGMYCLLEFDDPYCSACRRYSLCKVGQGVLVQGTANSDVKCAQCPSGTFSDTVSYTDQCRPHTNCHGRAVVRKGDAMSDTVCQSETFTSSTRPQASPKEPFAKSVFTTARKMISTVSATSEYETLHGTTNSMLYISSTEAAFNYSTKSPPTITVNAVSGTFIVIGIVLLILLILLCLWKEIWRKDTSRFQPKVDANGNCETADKINPGFLEETKQTSFTVTPPEQKCLLEGNGEACNGHSQFSNDTENIKSGEDCSTSIGPLQSTIALQNPHSALSEPMTLLSNTEAVTPQTSVSTQSSSQPTSPHIISPVTTSPHVNVNITFHIGNGSGGASSVMPTDLKQVDSTLRFGEEEESFSIPQQEDGKQSLMSVQESTTYIA